MPRRGTTTERGYGPDHKRLRAFWAPFVAAGSIICWRCGRRISPGSPWDLGHVDGDKSRYRGPEHARCSRSAGASYGNERRYRKVRSRDW